jgi:DNA-binding GntR family transcriptional regulator
MSTSSLSQRTYDYIQTRILSGEFPAGSVVSELSLAKAVGVSRTPVREAIRQLTIEGLVEQVPRFGTIVRAPDRQELTELYEVREALESYAAAAAARHITPGDLKSIVSLVREMRSVRDELRQSGTPALEGKLLRRFLAADMGFHMLLIRVAGNRKIMRIVGDTRALTRIFGTRRQEHTCAIVVKSCRFHREILRAIERRDPAAARSWMARHIRVSRKQMLEGFSHHQERVGQPIPLGIPDHLLEEFNQFDLGFDEPAMEGPDRAS